jgi:hypothetical protein
MQARVNPNSPSIPTILLTVGSSPGCMKSRTLPVAWQACHILFHLGQQLIFLTPFKFHNVCNDVAGQIIPSARYRRADATYTLGGAPGI